MIDYILGLLTFFSFALIVLYGIAFMLERKNKNHPLVRILGEYGFLLNLLIALAATIGSLVYSEIVGFEPCKFCWLQRIFMYPQVFLLGIALYRKDWNIAIYCITLSSIGALIGLNQYLLQLTGTSFIPCGATGSLACDKIFVEVFGFITIPLMSLSGFVLMIVSMLFVKKYKKIA